MKCILLCIFPVHKHPMVICVVGLSQPLEQFGSWAIPMLISKISMEQQVEHTPFMWILICIYLLKTILEKIYL